MKNYIITALIIIILSSCNQRKRKPLDIEGIEFIKNSNGHDSILIVQRDIKDSSYIKLSFHSNGEIDELTEYVNGTKNGKNFYWEEDGSLILESYFTNGKYDYVTREVYSNGRTAFEGRRIETKFEGVTNSFYESGAIRERWTRVNDKDKGISIEYYENGRIKRVSEITDTGYVELEIWDEEGTRIK